LSHQPSALTHLPPPSPPVRGNRSATGAHRLAAAKLLGWSHIEAFILDATDVEAEL
jgi:hypothetical protein